MESGPANIESIIEHVQRKTGTTRRSVQDVINHDPRKRFVRTPDRRVAANLFHMGLNPDIITLMVVPDGQKSRPGPILQQSGLLWLTRYPQAVNNLTLPLPERVALTGPRAAGFALDDSMEIVVVVDDRDRPNLEPWLTEIAAAASEQAPSVQPQISILSPEQWDRQQASERPESHHNVWLAPHTAPQVATEPATPAR